MRQEEINEACQRQDEIILDRKTRLANTDYIAAKLAEGVATKEEYAEQLSQRQQWRDDINAAIVRIAELEEEVPEEVENQE